MNRFVKLTLSGGALVGALATAGAARADSFELNYEAPGVETSTATFSKVGVESFDDLATGKDKSFTVSFGDTGVTGAYSGSAGVQINAADQYGGAGGTGKYAVAFPNDPYTLTLNQSVNYFGYWLSALDKGNIVTFYNNGVQVGQIAPDTISAVTQLNSSYYGNPNKAFKGQDSGEPFAFINFYDTTGTFNQIAFSEGNNFGGGYESDNHTVGLFTAVSTSSPVVDAPAAVPEPSTWAMIGLGFAGLAFAARRSRRAPRLAAA